MSKHQEYGHTVSPSGKLLFCLQRVWCGGDLELVVKLTNGNRVVYAEIHTDGFTMRLDGNVTWEIDANGNDILVVDNEFDFIERDGSLILVDCCDIDGMQTEHRLVRYMHDPSQSKPCSYDPMGHKTDFNCEMVISGEHHGELFERWRKQDKCKIYLEDYPNNPYHPKHDEFSKQSKEEQQASFRSSWFIQQRPWSDYDY